MRWSGQRVGGGDVLPGMDGLVRSVRTPEFAGTVFHEVEARSALNRVPGGSAMPFSWTVNPYRGCSHACVYCLHGDTRVLMADGTLRRIAELRVGDLVVGTEPVDGIATSGERGATGRRYAVTPVLAHWSTVKPAVRVRLAGGTEIVASGEHRFLTDRGWRHVTGGWCRSGRRPRLRPGSRLVGPGRTADLGAGRAAVPRESRHTPAYRRGYLCGLVRADAPAPGEPECSFPSEHLTLEALGRVHHFLADPAVLHAGQAELGRSRSGPVPWSGDPAPPWARAHGARGPGDGEPAGFLPAAAGVPAAREPWTPRSGPSGAGVPGRTGGSLLADAVRWPTAVGRDWCAGFLAGVLDARGGAREGQLWFGGDAEVLVRVADALHRLGFRHVREPGVRGSVAVAAASPVVRLAGGPGEVLRLLERIDPAVVRSGALLGAPVAAADPLEVVDVEATGEPTAMYDITTGTGDFVAEGVVSHNCFARNSHTWLGLDAGADFDGQIVVKVNVARVLERELASPRWRGEPVAMGTNTDPYQRAEGRYRLMPGIVEALARSRTPLSILTKGTVLTRDLPLLAEVARDVPVHLGVSIAVLDRELQASLEPGTPSAAARLDLVRRIADVGVGVGVLVAPVLPLLTDSDEHLDALLGRIREAGATGASVLALHLRPGTREWFLAWLAREHPKLVGPYARLYRRGAYADPEYRRALGRRVGALLRRHGLTTGSDIVRGTDPDPDGRRAGAAPADPHRTGAAPAAGEQLSLL